MRPWALLGLLGTAAGGPLVAVDVGHTRDRPGAVSATGRGEFEFNRDLAREVARALEAQGLSARVIGLDGEAPSLQGRAASAREAALLLSLHHDSVQPRYLETARRDGRSAEGHRLAGFSLFVSRKNRRPARSRVCASAIGASLRTAGFQASAYHAEEIPGEGRPFADRRNGVHFHDDLIVLKSARPAAVLLEAGVIVNSAEEERLSSPEVRRAIGRAVAEGVSRCLSRQPKRTPRGREAQPTRE